MDVSRTALVIVTNFAIFLVSARGQSDGQMPSQPPGETGQPPPPNQENPLLIAANQRAEIAASVVGGGTSVDAALTRLRALESPSGLMMDRDAGFSLAAVDLGHRLLAAHKPAEAEQFFRAAEAALTGLLDAKVQREPADRALYLARRAELRAKYLNRAVEARADFDAALELQPTDEALMEKRRHFANGRAEDFKPAATK